MELVTGIIIFVAVTMFLWKMTAWLVVIIGALLTSDAGCAGCLAGVYLLPCAYIGYIFAINAVAILFK